MTRLLNHVRRNVVGYLALFVALGGAGYAAATLPAGSVGTAQLRNGSITPHKLNGRTIGGYVLAWAHVSAAGPVLSGSPGARATKEPGGPTNVIGYNVRWRKSGLPARCSPIVTLSDNGSTALLYAKAAIQTAGGGPHDVDVVIYNLQGQPVAAPFYLAVIC